MVVLRTSSVRDLSKIASSSRISLATPEIGKLAYESRRAVRATELVPRRTREKHRPPARSATGEPSGRRDNFPSANPHSLAAATVGGPLGSKYYLFPQGGCAVPGQHSVAGMPIAVAIGPTPAWLISWAASDPSSVKELIRDSTAASTWRCRRVLHSTFETVVPAPASRHSTATPAIVQLAASPFGSRGIGTIARSSAPVAARRRAGLLRRSPGWVAGRGRQYVSPWRAETVETLPRMGIRHRTGAIPSWPFRPEPGNALSGIATRHGLRARSPQCTQIVWSSILEYAAAPNPSPIVPGLPRLAVRFR